MLIRRGADPLARSNQGKTPLNYASTRGYPQCVVLLEAAEAKVREQAAAQKALREQAEREEAEERAALEAAAEEQQHLLLIQQQQQEQEQRQESTAAVMVQGEESISVKEPSVEATPNGEQGLLAALPITPPRLPSAMDPSTTGGSSVDAHTPRSRVRPPRSSPRRPPLTPSPRAPTTCEGSVTTPKSSPRARATPPKSPAPKAPSPRTEPKKS